MFAFSTSLHRFTILLFFLCSFTLASAQVKICTWNLQNFGKSKSDAEVAFVANILRHYDVVALQEIVAGYGGPQAVARLADALNRKGEKWDYLISEPTNSSPHSTERYAYLWKTSMVKRLKGAWLDQNYVSVIDREPFLMAFSYKSDKFTLVSFHAIPKKKQPETEIKYLKFFPETYSERNLIFLGDFNLPQSHTVFSPLKRLGYCPVFINQKTTMKMECTHTCLASEYDNIFYNTAQIQVLSYGFVPFYKSFPDMKAARRISDHVPLWVEVDFSTTELAKMN